VIRLSAQEVHARKVAELGLDPSAVDLRSIEALAGALRRAASVLCPCTASTLVRSVVGPLRGLVDDLAAIKDLVEDTLEAMIAHGDFLEQRDIEADQERGAALLYAAPPGFVSRKSGAVILVGVASDQVSALPDSLQLRTEYVNNVRRLSPVPGEDLRSDLKQHGLIETSYDSWLRAPPVETPARRVSRLNSVLDAAPPSRDVPGLSLLDPQRPIRHYRGRWTEPRAKSGRFVARRSQAYGADLWCYAQLRDGNPERIVDLPVAGSRWRGCDEAWHVQLAIDWVRGEPQEFRIRSGLGATRVMELFSPVPMWARRRWDAVGEPVPGSGFLFAYRFAEAELDEELRFAREALWLRDTTDTLLR